MELHALKVHGHTHVHRLAAIIPLYILHIYVRTYLSVLLGLVHKSLHYSAACIIYVMRVYRSEVVDVLLFAPMTWCWWQTV